MLIREVMKMKSCRTFTFIVFLCVATTAFAEVTDKMPSISELYRNSVVMGFALAGVGFFFPSSWIGRAFVTLFTLILVWPPAVEPEFLEEALRYFGPSYEFHAQISWFLVPVIAVAGYTLGLLRQKKT